MAVDLRKSHFRIRCRDPWSELSVRRSVWASPPSLCKISAKSAQQFRSELMRPQQTGTKYRALSATA